MDLACAIIEMNFEINEELELYGKSETVLVLRSKTSLTFTHTSGEVINYYPILDYRFKGEYRMIKNRYMLLDEGYDYVEDLESIPDIYYNTVEFDCSYEFMTLGEIHEEVSPFYNILKTIDEENVLKVEKLLELEELKEEY